MSMQQLNLTKLAITFQGAISVEQTSEGAYPWRIPFTKKNLFEPALIDQASTPAGVRLALVSDTSKLNISASTVGRVNPLPEEPDENARFDLLVDGNFHQRFSGDFGKKLDVTFDNLPDGEHRLEVFLPQSAKVTIHSAEIDEHASAKKFQDPRPRWTVYGSSITHCRRSFGPAETWPALVAREFDLNMTCLGFGGSCHMEPMVAKMIRDIPADYISFCLGINTRGSLSERTFRAAVIGLIDTVREKHPNTPIACVSPICSPPNEDTKGAAGTTLKLMRQWVDNAVETFKGYGDKNIYHINGLDILGQNDTDWLVSDQVHPSGQGDQNIAKRYSKLVMEEAFGMDGGRKNG